MKRFIILLVVSIQFLCLQAQTDVTRVRVRGLVVDSVSGKGLSHFPVKINEFDRTSETNKKGEFLFNLPAGNYVFVFEEFPYIAKEYQLDLRSDTTLKFVLSTPKWTRRLNELEVVAQKKITKIPTGVTKLNSADLAVLPALIGERDVIKTLSLTSGVSSGGEGSSDMQVRGSTHGQNLFLLDNVPLYSTNHMFGLVSVYNPVIVKSFSLYKSGFPAEYGCRIASVLDVETKTPSLVRKSGELDLSLISTKAFLSVPLLKNKAAFSIAGRVSNYSLSKLFQSKDSEREGTVLYFYDINADFLAKLTDRDMLRFVLFANSDGVDVTQIADRKVDVTMQSNNQQFATLTWSHRSDRLGKSSLQLSADRYNFFMHSESKNRSASTSYLKLKNEIFSYGISGLNDLSLVKHLSLKSGFSLKSYGFRSDSLQFRNVADGDALRMNNQLEMSLHTQLSFKVFANDSLNAGIRFSFYGNTDKLYAVPEPRFVYRGNLGRDFAWNATFSRMSQGIHRVANPGMGMPFELFSPSLSGLKPEKAWVYSVGLAKEIDFRKNILSFKTDFWYKHLSDIVDFKDGYDAMTILMGTTPVSGNPLDYLTQGKGFACGLDFSTTVNLHGILRQSVDYTLLRARNKFGELNNGKWFDANTDIRHSLSLVNELKISDGWSMVVTWQLHSGRPVTIPTVIYPQANLDYDTATVEFENGGSDDFDFNFIHGERNNARMRPFHKLDLAFNRSYITRKGYKAAFSIGVYNLYNRANPAFYFIDKQLRNGVYYPVLKSVSMFSILPSVSWNLKF